MRAEQVKRNLKNILNKESKRLKINFISLSYRLDI